MKKKDVTIAAIVVLLIAAGAYTLNAVRRDRPATPSEASAKLTGDSAKAKASDRVVMHVNGEAITEEELKTYVAGAGEQAQMVYQTPQGRRRIADEFVKLKALEQEGQRRGLADDPEVKAQLEMVRAQIIASKTLEKIVKEGIEQRVRAEYDKEKASAKSLKHIVVAYQGAAIPPRQGQPLTEAQAMAKANAIAARLRGGADFGQIAAQESDDQQSAAQGGSLGPAQPDQLPPEIASVVRSLTQGQISAPVKTQFGVHIFKIDVPTLEELRPMLTQKVQQKGVEEAVTKYQKAAKVELDPKFFPEVPAVPAVPSAPAAPGSPQRKSG